MFQPSVDVLKRLAVVLEVGVDYLLSDENADVPYVHVENKALTEQIRLIGQLDPEDQQALFRIIDSMLTKHRMQQLLDAGRLIDNSPTKKAG